MENNLENKSKFFALYWEQKVFYSSPKQERAHRNTIARLVRKGDFLELTPLSQITDEHRHHIGVMVHWRACGCNKSIEDELKDKTVASVYYRFGMDFINFITGNYDNEHSDPYWIGNVKRVHSIDAIFIYDYLRSKGYALPFMGVSVETLIEWGWIKLVSQ